MTLKELYEFPNELLECEARELHALLGGPALVHLSGRQTPALVVSTLLHGNETSGWDAVRALLREDPDLQRNVMVLIGNTQAAAAGVRTLPGQQDFNRIWKNATGPEADFADAFRARIADQPLFAAVDLHNNTGHNPHYAVLTNLAESNLGLAFAFSGKAVFIEEPDTVLTRVFDGHCPAVTLELGPVGEPSCVDRAYDYLKRLLTFEKVPRANARDLELFRTRVRVHISDSVDFGFAGDARHVATADPQLVLTAGMEGVNFHDVTAGTVFGDAAAAPADVFRVLDGAHVDVTDEFFLHEDGRLLLRQDVVPAMYTTDPDVIRQDCLCYFMERLQIDEA